MKEKRPENNDFHLIFCSTKSEKDVGGRAVDAFFFTAYHAFKKNVDILLNY